MDIIALIRDIDGIPYYIMLVVNAILIFAIIGYLGDKKNEKYAQFLKMTGTPTSASSRPNFAASTTDKHSDTSIPTVAPTMVTNPLPNTEVVQNVIDQNPVQTTTPTMSANALSGFEQSGIVQGNSPVNTQSVVNNSVTTQGVNYNATVQPSVAVNQATVGNNTVVNTNYMNGANNNINQGPIIRPEDNEVDPNEKVPAVLVINSDNTNMPK